MAFLTLFLFVSQVCLFAAAGESPCSIYDGMSLTNLVQNMFSAMAYGNTDKGMQCLDPMIHPGYAVDKNGLKIQLPSDVTIEGLAKTAILEVHLDSDAQKISIISLTPMTTMTGSYKSCGAFKNVPMNGEGSFKYEAYGLKLSSTFDYVITKGDDGNNYFTFTDNYTYFSARDTVAQFSNLNSDDCEAAAQAKKLLMYEGSQFMLEYGKEEIKQIMHVIRASIKIMLGERPIQSMVYDYPFNASC